MWDIIIAIIILSIILFGLTRLLGYRNKNITIELDNRYSNLTEHAKAVVHELERQGRNVKYRENGYFLIDDRLYMVHTRNAAMGGIPLQRTVLVPVKK
ncbi:hypothetical protein CFK37_19040 [Virgibacillus phasianinus]|uniref:Uncharacterized protein n=1 Tax=Virgibacillus phasianinus TaxID=2017483 RepID=A0A220U7L5_9BACI|nr:hypothetical protein [Virgibacillus phasianinus]ASK64100.1 hypothetical protein CFK37_19040 [Virgibacillus phasianinus]